MRINYLFLCLFFSACQWLSSYPDTPEEVTLRFRKAILKGNFSQARQYCDETSANFLSIMEGMHEMSPEADKVQNSTLAQTLTVVNCRFNPERTKARCTVCCNANNDVFADASDLVLKDGYWRIWVSKFGENNLEDSIFETPVSE